MSAAPAWRVRGPAIAGDDPRRFWDLARTLAAMDWKVRFYGSALGYAWSLLRPLALFGIVFFVFSVLIDAGAGVAHYGVLLLVGMILYFLLSEVTGSGLTSLVDREALLRKVGFPRAVVPVSVALVATMNLALNLVVLAIFTLASGVTPRWSWLALPVPIALTALLAATVALGLSALYVRYRDVKPIWEVVLQALFYATPILYPIEVVLAQSQALASAMLCNPLAALVQETRHLLVGGTSLAEAIGPDWLMAVPAAVGAAIAALCLRAFARLAPQAAEEL